MEATKRPWKLSKLSETDRDFAYRIDSAEMFSPCLVYRDGKLNAGIATANARLIVTAVNHFEEMREALEHTLTALQTAPCTCNDDRDCQRCNANRQARALWAKISE